MVNIITTQKDEALSVFFSPFKQVKGTFILVDILSYPTQTFRSDSSISYYSFQHARSRSKKLKTPEDKKVSTIVVGTEITAIETATDNFKVNEKPPEKVKQVNTAVPSGEEQDISRMQIDQNLLDNKKVSGEMNDIYFL